MADSAADVDLDSVIDRLLEGEFGERKQRQIREDWTGFRSMRTVGVGRHNRLVGGREWCRG